MRKAFLIILSILALNLANLWAAHESHDAGKKDLVSMTNESAAQPTQIEGKKVYICAMDPGVIEKAPGKCPKCRMDLQEVTLREEEGSVTAGSEGAEQMKNELQAQQVKQNTDDLEQPPNN